MNSVQDVQELIRLRSEWEGESRKVYSPTGDSYAPGQVHDAVLVEHGHLHGHIDVEIASLMKGLWTTGIRTQLSCAHIEHDGPIAMISISTSLETERFARRLLMLTFDWTPFEVQEARRGPGGGWFGGFGPGLNGWKVPFWNAARGLKSENITFPRDYIPQFTDAAWSPDVKSQ